MAGDAGSNWDVLFRWLRPKSRAVYDALGSRFPASRRRVRAGLLKVGQVLANRLPFPKREYEWLTTLYVAYVLRRIEETPTGEKPFRHIYIERVFPRPLYRALLAHMLECKYSGKLQDRPQDSAKFVNKRFSLKDCDALPVRLVRALLDSPIVKRALLGKFYSDPSLALMNSVTLHQEEFEYVHCGPKLFQDVHVDIPPKYLSFVFYLPETTPTVAEQETNATMFYDADLVAQNTAKYRPNSVGIFAPHFYTYHGFASTTARNVLVAFYVNLATLKEWRASPNRGEPPFTTLLDIVERKLLAHPLVEYQEGARTIADHRRACQVNAKAGRVIRKET